MGIFHSAKAMVSADFIKDRGHALLDNVQESVVGGFIELCAHEVV